MTQKKKYDSKIIQLYDSMPEYDAHTFNMTLLVLMILLIILGLIAAFLGEDGYYFLGLIGIISFVIIYNIIVGSWIHEKLKKTSKK